MGDRESLIEQLRSFRKDLSQRIHVDRMIFFGSRASGNAHKDSDVDLVIVSDDFQKNQARFRALGFRSFWNLDCGVDFLCVTKDEFETMSNQVTIIREAVRTGIDIQ